MRHQHFHVSIIFTNCREINLKLVLMQILNRNKKGKQQFKIETSQFHWFFDSTFR